MGKKYPLHVRLWSLGERRELSQRGTPAEPKTGFITGSAVATALY